MDSIDFTQVALAFGALLLLLALFYYGARALSGATARGTKWRPGQRIGVVDSMPVDGTRRLVLVRDADALCTSTTGVWPLTVIVSSRAPTFISASIFAVKSPESSRPSRLNVLNPASVNVTL